MKEAVIKAIEGGWNPKGSNGVIKWTPEMVEANYYYQHTYLMFPEFWQSLGKELDWNNLENPDYFCSVCGIDFGDGSDGRYDDKTICHSLKPHTYKDGKSWLRYWHRFIDHLAEGKDPADFFISLR